MGLLERPFFSFSFSCSLIETAIWWLELQKPPCAHENRKHVYKLTFSEVLTLAKVWDEKWKMKVKSLSRVRLLATPWTAAYQASPSMGFSRQEYWSGVPLPSQIILPTTEQNLALDLSLVFWSHGSAKSLQLCPIHCDPMDCSPPGSSVCRILQAKILEWVAMS